ncbi:LysR family transcriptional regulator [Microbacterium sp. M3]|uniref:LysR family transcriptional regulator n=1 Tax=Microbacterium arthrosphaerae TaxID=792652 RepID=A0ABU4H6E8_9MICO|nr:MULTISPECIES: LysR family transcriptional regulator [Microbacterium]MDW4574214.1 LysR family transcriptional regulator [Microbacterium arthrosphaerae]MDW7608069.1 LysR family transcriptional regulator [Microbacterium sp. M3]
MPDLDLLRTFVEVHRAGSISAAATRLGVSQPSVSERLARLEADLGAVLFVRSSRGAAPTPAGDALAARVTGPIAQLHDVWATPDPGPPQAVRIGGASDVIAARVVPALAPLTRQGLRLDFALGLADDLLTRLADGDLDVVVSSVRTPRRGIRYRGLVDEEFVLVGAPALARTIDRERAAEAPAAALQHLPLVAYDADLSIVRRYWRSQFGHRPANAVAMVVPDLRAVLAAVVAGVGVSALPRYLAEPAILSGAVEVLHRPDEAPINTLHLAIRAGEPVGPAPTRVIELLAERARDWDVF